MSTHTGKTHLGFAVNVEELEHDDIIAGNSKTLALLIDRQKGVDWTVDNLRKENADLQGFLNTAEERIAALEKPAPVPVAATPSLDLTPMPETAPAKEEK